MQIDIEALKTQLPDLAVKIDRLHYLSQLHSPPRIAVFGKYNHGKSTLLNALVDEGKEIFKATDKRETRENQEYFDEKNQLIWIDTPGLDAEDVDDERARAGAITTADVILLVHNIKTGELDKPEVKHFEYVLQQTTEATKIILVISQIDQVANQADFDKALAKIKHKFPQLETHCVSAVRYEKFKGKAEKAVAQSGIPNLMRRLNEIKKDVGKDRKRSQKILIQAIKVKLQSKRNHIDEEYFTLSQQYEITKAKFIQDMDRTFNKIRSL